MARKNNKGGQKDRYGRYKPFVGRPDRCHLCFLPMSEIVVSPTHKLFRTLDHIIPLSRGGTDTLRNRAPAHSFCNSSKGNRVEVSFKERLDMTLVVAPLLRDVGIPISKRRLADVRNQLRLQFGGSERV